MPQDVRYNCVRSSRVVLSPRRWGQANGDAISALRPKRRDPFAMVANKPGHQGEHGAAVKPLRRECRSCRPTCTDLWAFSFSAHEPCGCGQRPAFPAPSTSGGPTNCKTRAQHRAAGMRSRVIARSVARVSGAIPGCPAYRCAHAGYVVIASQRVRPSWAGPMTGSAKQSILSRPRRAGLLRRFRLRSASFSGQVAPRNDGAEVLFEN
jgi:hypothetical protein